MTKGTVRWCNAEEGWGVIDSDETPGGCAVIFMYIKMDGYKFLTSGQSASFTWVQEMQDDYDYRAVSVTPH